MSIISENFQNDLIFNRFCFEIKKILDRLNNQLSYINNNLFLYVDYNQRAICIYTKTRKYRNVKIYFFFENDVDYLEEIKSNYPPFSFYKVAYCFNYDMEEFYDLLFNEYYRQVNYYLAEDIKEKSKGLSSSF